MKIFEGIMIILLEGLVLACLLLSQACAAERDLRMQQIDAIFTGLISETEPGAAVLVVKDGQVVFERGYGVRDLKTLSRIDAITNFRLASLTKQFTAMAVMLLVHDGKIHYDDRLSDIFSDFAEYGRNISIRNLLNHTSGLLDYENLMPKVSADVSIEENQIKDHAVLELLEHQNSTKFDPGNRWNYSNSGYVLLGLIIEKVSGKPFGQFLHDRIFTPLRMKHTVVYERGKNEVSNRAYGHTIALDGWHHTDQSLTSATRGDGCIYSSIEDLAKWDKSLRENSLLPHEEMQSALIPVKVPEGFATQPDGTPAEYGFGWFLNSYLDHARMWHYGETMGFRTAIQRFIDDGLTIIVLCNRTDIDAGELTLKIADLYLKDTH